MKTQISYSISIVTGHYSPGPDTGVSTLTFVEGPLIPGATRGAGPPPKKRRKKKKNKERSKEMERKKRNSCSIVD